MTIVEFTTEAAGWDGLESIDLEVTFGPDFMRVSKPCIGLSIDPSQLAETEQASLMEFLETYVDPDTNKLPLYTGTSAKPVCEAEISGSGNLYIKFYDPEDEAESALALEGAA